MTERVDYRERTATVVGGKGRLGSKIVGQFETLGFKDVLVCGEGDPFLDFLNRSSDLFLAVDNVTALKILEDNQDHIRTDQTIADGASVKIPLIRTYRRLDRLGISVCSVHVGASPKQPFRGVKVWICEVGPNSNEALLLNRDLFVTANSSIRNIRIEEHKKVEEVQWFTFAATHVLAAALKDQGFGLETFDDFATLNSEFAANLLGITMGQNPTMPREILYNQRRKNTFMKALSRGLKDFRRALQDSEELLKLIIENSDFHNDPEGTIQTIFKRAGVIGARSANLRMHKLSFRTTEDRSGQLRRLLSPFDEEGANLTAIDSMPGEITEEERGRGVDPDRIIDFDIGIEPDTIDDEKERRIKEQLTALGCTVT